MSAVVVPTGTATVAAAPPPAMRPQGVRLLGVTRRFGSEVVLDALDLEIRGGEVTALMGPNGCGKTTVGRLVLRLDVPDEGLLVGAEGRQFAAVFQEDRLCDHLGSVANVCLGTPRTGGATRPAAEAALREVGLDEASLTKPVRELSGGQRRRVAIVRALLPNADILVLDEPFTGLDTEAKPLIVDYVKERIAGRTVLLITHDPAEARALGARVVRLP